MRAVQTLRLLPVVVSTLVLGAHLFRAGLPLALALAVALLPLALIGARPAAVRLVQAVLLLGAVEWVRTLVLLVAARRAAHLPHLRLALILAAVAATSALAAWSLANWRRRHAARRAPAPASRPVTA